MFKRKISISSHTPFKGKMYGTWANHPVLLPHLVVLLPGGLLGRQVLHALQLTLRLLLPHILLRYVAEHTKQDEQSLLSSIMSCVSCVFKSLCHPLGMSCKVVLLCISVIHYRVHIVLLSFSVIRIMYGTGTVYGVVMSPCHLLCLVYCKLCFYVSMSSIRHVLCCCVSLSSIMYSVRCCYVSLSSIMACDVMYFCHQLCLV